jgi:hypothetical protein
MKALRMTIMVISFIAVLALSGAIAGGGTPETWPHTGNECDRYLRCTPGWDCISSASGCEQQLFTEEFFTPL